MGEKRNESQAEMLYIMEGQIVIVGNSRCPGFGVQAVRERFAQGLHTSAGAKLRLKYGYVVASPIQFVSGDQSSKTRADHQNLLRRPRLLQGLRSKAPAPHWSDVCRSCEKGQLKKLPAVDGDGHCILRGSDALIWPEL